MFRLHIFTNNWQATQMQHHHQKYQIPTPHNTTKLKRTENFQIKPQTHTIISLLIHNTDVCPKPRTQPKPEIKLNSHNPKTKNLISKTHLERQLERETCICYFDFINPIGSFLDPAAMAPQSLKESKRRKSNFDGLNLLKKAKVPNLFL